MVEIWVGGAVLCLIALGLVFYRPIVCAVCGDAMVRTGPNKLMCLGCGREGHG